VSFDDRQYTLTLHTISTVEGQTEEEKLTIVASMPSAESSPAVYAHDETPPGIKSHLENQSDDFRKVFFPFKTYTLGVVHC